MYFDVLDRSHLKRSEGIVVLLFEGIEHTARNPPQTARRLVDLFETDNPDNRRIQHKGRAATNPLRLLVARASAQRSR